MAGPVITWRDIDEALTQLDATYNIGDLLKVIRIAIRVKAHLGHTI